MQSSRRDVLRSLLGASLAAACTPPESRGSLDHLQGHLLGPDVGSGHALRDGRLTMDLWRSAPRRTVDAAVLGGGPAGLSAAWRLRRHGIDRLIVLELEDTVGGTSRGGHTAGIRYPWGAHYLPVPMPHHEALCTLLHELSALDGADERGVPIGAEHLLIREPDERLFEHGFWHQGLTPAVGTTDRDRGQLRRFQQTVDRYVALRDGQGRRAFAIPMRLASDDASLAELDRISAAAWLETRGFDSPVLGWLCRYACRDDYGLTLEDTSAWALLFYFAARTVKPGTGTMDLLAWPDGNATLVRHLERSLGDRVRTGWLVADVQPSNDRVAVYAWNPSTKRAEIIEARRAICALPRFVAQHVVRPLRKTPAEWTSYGAWAVANLHLHGRPTEHGSEPAWDNVLFDSPSVGYVNATHQRAVDHGPTVWTYYYPFIQTDPRAGRRTLLDVTWEEWAETITVDLKRPHPDLMHHLSRLDVWRWGHGMVQPRVGHVFHPERRHARTPIGALHFAHSDLSGIALFEEAFDQGIRAADEVRAALHPPAGNVSTR